MNLTTLYMCTHNLCLLYYASPKRYGECSLLVWMGQKLSAGRQSGWEAIIGMYQLECESMGNARMVSKLHEIHVLRDGTERLFSKDDAGLVTFANVLYTCT